MNRARAPHLRPAILKFATLALIGATATTLGWRQALLERDLRERLHAERRVLDARLAATDRDLAELAARAERYRRLDARGLLGAERRLDWIDLITAVRVARQLFDVDYDFAAQRPLEATPSPSVAAVASTMKLRMPLLHEGDLIAILEDLAERAPALLQIRECRLERVAAEPHDTGPAARLAASCRIDWITLQVRA